MARCSVAPVASGGPLDVEAPQAAEPQHETTRSDESRAADRRGSRRGSTSPQGASEVPRRNSDLGELGRRLTKRLSEAIVAQQQPEQTRDARPALERQFDDLVKHLMKEDALDLAAVKGFVQAWLRENVSHLDPEQRLQKYEELFSDVMPSFLLGHVKKAKRAVIWDAIVTIKTVLLTWGDTASSWKRCFEVWGLSVRQKRKRSRDDRQRERSS